MNSTRGRQPLVAVVIPAYNSARFIRRAIDSALVQDYPNKEIIVVDDGSTDDTATIAESYGPPVRVIRQANAGPDVARNTAIHATEAECVAFLDSDDEWLPGRLTKGLAPLIEDPGVGLTFCHAVTCYPDGREVPFGHEVERHRVFPRVLWQPATHCTPATICRRAVVLEVGGFDRPLLAFADHDLWIRIREQSKAVEITDQLVRVHARNESRSRNKKEDAVYDCYFQIINDALKRRPDLYETHRATITADACLFWGIRFYSHGLHSRARAHFWRSFRAVPTRRALGFVVKTLFPAALMRRVREWRRSRAGNDR